MRAQGRRGLTVAFYVLLVAVLAGVLFQVWSRVLPGPIAVRVGHNSEGYLLALILAAWIQFVRPRLRASSAAWAVTLAASACCVAMAVLLLLTDYPSRFKTLNETFLAAALVIPYLQLRRPLPRYLAAGLSAAVLVGVVALNRTAAVTDLAETLGVLILVPIGFDLVDRAILDPAAVTSTRLRYGWYAFLVAAPLAFSLLEYTLDIGSDGVLGEAVRYAVRITEAFVCMLLVELWFTLGLGRTGPRAGRPAAAERSNAR